MDCNKDEAARAKKKAEEKFTAKDIMGAKKFALKAQNLFPGLEGISQMLASLDVHISAENKVNGEVDWYKILGVDPQADDETVRKHYRKLALNLHPDKNKSIGADGAFKLISQAWSMLSDKAKRVVYDQKRNGNINRNVSTSRGASSSQSERNGFYNFTKTATTSNAKVQKSAPRSDHSPASSQKTRPTFWTVCHRCKMQYEYLRVYLNHNLLCPNCHEPFFAIETHPPSSKGVKSNGWDFTQPNYRTGSKTAYSRGSSSNIASSSHMGAGESNHSRHSESNFQWGPFSRTGGASSAAQAATVVQQAYEKVKRQREEAQAAKREERRKHQSSKKTPRASSTGYSGAVKRRRGIDDISSSSHARDIANQSKTGMESTKPVNLSGCIQGNIKGISTLKSSRDVSLNEFQSLLIAKAKKEIRVMLHELNSTTASVKEGIGNEKRTGKGETVPVSGKLHNKDISTELLSSKMESKSVIDFPSNSGLSDAETMLIDVPDSDFHNFDLDRAESSFGDNQVWAAYDNANGMPRRYALIRSVVSLSPFKVQIRWLNSITDNEFGALSWVSSGFPKTCGSFRSGRCEIYNSLNSFSHKVRWTKGTYGDICIYPRKGDVWALYRNWSPDWNELTLDEVIQKYDVVEVLEDYDKELGVIVTPLVKVAGFKAVFHLHLDPNQLRMIPKDEIFRFSHLVPSHLLTGQESPNAPEGCRELDPAATPVDLLHVVETPKEEIIEIESLKLQSPVTEIVDISDEKMGKKHREARREEIIEIEGMKLQSPVTEIVDISDEIMDKKPREARREEIIEIEGIKLQSSVTEIINISDEKMDKKPREARKEEVIVKPVAVGVEEDILELKLVGKTMPTDEMQVS